MSKLSDIGAIKQILAKHGFQFSKSLGQNFLINPSVCPRMAEAGGAAEGCGVLEIGPGIGVLTYELAQRADKVVAVELDRRLLPVLRETLAEFRNVVVINDDILKVNLKSLLAQEFGEMPVSVCANLPYYITSPVIMKLLEEKLPIASLTVMVQKEAADRLCALPGTRQAGAVSVAVRYYAEPELLFKVSRGSFLPAPNVDSAVIRLRVRKQPAVAVQDEPFFFLVVRAAFGQRRKTVHNSLSAGLNLPKEAVAQALAQAGISPAARAEQLTMEQFAVLTDTLCPQEQKRRTIHGTKR